MSFRPQSGTWLLFYHEQIGENHPTVMYTAIGENLVLFWPLPSTLLSSKFGN